MMHELKRNKRGIQSDEILLKTINQNPGLSQYELGRKLGWNAGRIDGSIRRLLNANTIIARILERNGRRVNLIYPKEEKPQDVIEVPNELLHMANPTWNQSAFMYALDSSTIGISGREMQEWAEISCFQEAIPVGRTEDKVILHIPEKFRRFYNLERRHKAVSVNGNNILITISGNIIEEKKYPS